MKIKLNTNITKQIKTLNEATPAPDDIKYNYDKAKNSGNPDDQEKIDNDNERFKNAYEYQCKRQFLNSKKQDKLLIDVKMPSDMWKPLIIDIVPEDLGNLMRALETDGKFLNIHNMVEDPQKTYDHASDFALNCFSKLEDMELSKKEYEKNDDNTLKGESYIYNGIYNQLNEDRGGAVMAAGAGGTLIAAGTAASAGAATGGLLYRIMTHITDINPVNQLGLKVGWNVGKAAGNIMNGAAQTTIACIGGVAVQMSLTAAALYLSGYFGEMLFGHADGLKGYNNNKELQNSNISSDDKSDEDSDKYWQGDNVIEAIDEYIKNIKESVANVIAQISPKPEEYNKFNEEINKYLYAEDQALEKYFKSTDEIVNAARRQEQEDELRYEKVKERGREKYEDFTVKFLGSMKDLTLDDIKWQQKVFGYYRSICGDGSGNYEKRTMYLNAIETGGAKKAIDLYRSQHPHDTVESIQYNGHVLNEDDNNASSVEKPVADVTAIYKAVNGNLAKLMDNLFPIGNGENIPGVKALSESMDRRIKVASDTVKDSIQNICATFNKGQNEKLGDKIKQFFLSHPLQANRLIELWSAHEEELQMRKNRRIKQMTDFGNTERTIGWTAKFCKKVIPELFARLFAYRYLLSILKRDGYYNYTPEALKEDESEWEQYKDNYMQNGESITEWILYHYGNDYTVDNKPYIDYDDHGATLQNHMNYASLMLMRLKGNAFNIENNTDIQVAHQIAGNDTGDKIQDLIKAMSAEINPDPDNMLDNVEKFKITNELKKTEPIIKSAFDKIVELKNSLNTDNLNMTAAWNLLAEKHEIFETYKKNTETVDKLIEKYNNLIKFVNSDEGKNLKNNGDNENSKQLKEAEQEIKNIFGEFTYNAAAPVELDFTNMINLPNNDNSRVDYYAYIVSFYKGLLNNPQINICTPQNNLNTPEGIQEVCRDTYLALKLITSGLFTISGRMPVMTKNDMDLDVLQKGLRLYANEPEANEKMPTLKDIYVYAGGDGDDFDKAYNNVDEALKEKPAKDGNKTSNQDNKELVYNRIIKLFSNPVESETPSIKVQDNIMNFFNNPSQYAAFSTLEIPTNVKQGKNITSLLEFAKIEERCTFTDSDQTKQNQFMDRLKAYIRYLIEYAISSTYSEEATRSVEFNVIIKDLHNAINIINKNKDDITKSYPFIKDAYINSGGTSVIDNKFDQMELNVNDNKATEAFNQRFIEYLQKPPINIDHLELTKNIKDCTITNLYELAFNSNISKADDIKYILNEEDDAKAKKFIDDFKKDIKDIIDNLLQSFVVSDNNKLFNVIVKQLNKSVTTNDINSIYSALKDTFVSAGGKGDELDRLYQLIDVNDQNTANKFINGFKAVLQNTDNLFKYNPNGGTIVPKPTVDINNLKFNENVKDCTASNLYSLVVNENVGKNDFKYQLTGGDQFMNNFKDNIKYIIGVYVQMANVEIGNSGKKLKAIINNLHDAEGSSDLNTYRTVYVLCDGDGNNFDSAINHISDNIKTEICENIKNNIANPTDAINYTPNASSDKINIKNASFFNGNDSIDYKKFIKDCSYTTISQLVDGYTAETQYDIINENDFDDQFMKPLKEGIVRIIAYSVQQALSNHNNDNLLTRINEPVIFGKTITGYAKDILTSLYIWADTYKQSQKGSLHNQDVENIIDVLNKYIEDMNNDFISIYDNTYKAPDTPIKLDLANASNIDLRNYTSIPDEGIFGILKHIKDLDNIPDIKTLYQKLSNLKVEGKYFKDLDTNKQATVINHVLDALEEINKGGLSLSFVKYKDINLL